MKLGKQKVFIPIKEIELDSSSPLSVIQGDCSYHFKCYVKEQQGYFLTETELRMLLGDAYDAGKDMGQFEMDDVTPNPKKPPTEDKYINSLLNKK